MLDPRLLMSAPQPVDPQKQQIAQMIMSGAPLQAPKAKRAAPVFGDPMRLSPQQQKIFDALRPADQMLFEDEYQRGADPEELFRMFDPTQNENPGGMFYQEDGQNRFNDAAAYQVADAGQLQPTFADKAKELGLDLNVTQAQRTGQALRLLQSESILRELENQGTRTGQRMLEVLPNSIENLLVDEDYGRFQQARDAFAEAAMRADTGATINESEWPRILRNLMPQPGDGPERLAQRRAAREVFIQSLMASSGDAQAIMPEIGQPVVPIPNMNPTEMSDDDILRALQGGN